MTDTESSCSNGHRVVGVELFCRTCGAAIPRLEPAAITTPDGVTCPNGHAMENAQRFCRICGAPAAPDVEPPLPPPPSGVAGALNPPVSAISTPRRRRWPWVVGAVIALGALVGGAAWVVNFNTGGDATNSNNATDTKPSGPCDPGVRWQQKYSPYADGALVGAPDITEVGMIQGGARIGFPNPSEFAAMGFTSYVPLPTAEYLGIDLAPRDGMPLRERTNETGPGRIFYSAGGAVYQVRDITALRSMGIDPSSAAIVPVNGLDGTPRRPKTGTLLRLQGSRRTWIVDGGVRRLSMNVCQGARLNVLPNDPKILDEIPIGPVQSGEG